MAFDTLAALNTYMQTYVKANGMNSITGDQLNTVLTGIIQFMGTYSTDLTSVQAIELGNGMADEGTTIVDTGVVALPSVGTGGTYGTGTYVPQITTDAYGRVTNVVNTLITAGGGGTFDIGTHTGNYVGVFSFVITTGTAYVPRFASFISNATPGLFAGKVYWVTYAVGSITVNFASAGTFSADVQWIEYALPCVFIKRGKVYSPPPVEVSLFVCLLR